MSNVLCPTLFTATGLQHLSDLTKVFDKVSHKHLWCSKPYSYGIRGNTLGWMQKFLKHRTQQVTVDSVIFKVTSQGIVLPLLCLLYVTLLDHLWSYIHWWHPSLCIFTTEDCKWKAYFISNKYLATYHLSV